MKAVATTIEMNDAISGSRPHRQYATGNPRPIHTGETLMATKMKNASAATDRDNGVTRSRKSSLASGESSVRTATTAAARVSSASVDTAQL